ncbi:MAG: DUF4956 domain-containing protein [Arenicellales bacterium]|jgi:hypothetical protein|nr:DUF4956 domain-containing protein [Gammaproteobacteria bacterium]MDP6267330.1 DUF4956 domain-containing protein [Arenicellales bacterium]MDP7452188.1 DUF4956 domain-containing protein [Arenicellales bacterium]|tara:strand:+ start:3117 stop:3698 length:582 start_codon:yes stop_codon:yes gene_type:complete
MENLNLDFLIRLVINTTATLVLVRFVYFRFSQHRAYANSFILFGLGVFLITSQLASVDISMGFAFGLFAIFAMLRYRTESITIKEMTYLFLVIAISLLSGVGTMTHLELLALVVIICLVAYITEASALIPRLEEQTIEYEKIENIVPERRSELIEDLTQRLGTEIKNVEIESVSFLRDTARLKIQFVGRKTDQ